MLFGCPIYSHSQPHVSVLRPSKPTRAAGVFGHSIEKFLEIEARKVDGLPLVSPGEAFVQAAGILSFRELVVAADHLIRPVRLHSRPQPIIRLDELRELVAASSARGIVRARTALKFARIGAESRMETILRFLLAQYGLDVFDLQVDLTDAHGRWIGRFDLVNLAHRLIVEYDGEQHRTSNEQYEHDQERLDRARDAGFRVLRFRRTQVIEQPLRTIQRVADALDLQPKPVRGQLARYFAE